MLNFEKLTIDNLKKWKNLIYGLDCNSESSIVNMYLWEHYYESLFCIDEGILYGIYTNKKTGNKEAFMPYGTNRCSEKVIDKLISFLKNDTPQSIPVINFATEDFLNYILDSGRYNINYCELPNSFDYVYNVRDLIDLKGKKYHSKKNHYNSFAKKYDFNYVRYENSLYEKCMEFCNNVIDEQIHSSQEAKKYELQSIKKALDNYDDLEIICSLLTIDDKIIALSVGEVLNDDYALIHIEKASYEYRTAYSVINRLMLQNEFGHMKFVNREEDLGIEGLRKAKESYHPCKYIKKYRIQFL